MTQHNDTPRRPVAQKTGLVILAGAFGASAAAAWLGARLLPLPQAAEALKLAGGSDAVWLLLGAALFFPLSFGLLLARLAGDAPRTPVLWAFGGGVYIVACSAEMYVRDAITLWPQLMLALASGGLLALLAPARPAEPEDDPESDQTDR